MNLANLGAMQQRKKENLIRSSESPTYNEEKRRNYFSLRSLKNKIKKV